MCGLSLQVQMLSVILFRKKNTRFSSQHNNYSGEKSKIPLFFHEWTVSKRYFPDTGILIIQEAQSQI